MSNMIRNRFTVYQVPTEISCERLAELGGDWTFYWRYPAKYFAFFIGRYGLHKSEKTQYAAALPTRKKPYRSMCGSPKVYISMCG